MNPRTMVLAGTLVLSACGGSAATSAPTPFATTLAGTTQASQSAAPSSSVAVASGNPVNGPDFCALLTSLEPRLSTDGSTAGALADLTIEFASWLDTHTAQKPRTAADLDEASQSSCPAMRTKVLSALGTDSFKKAFEG